MAGENGNSAFRLGGWLVQPDLNRLSDGSQVVTLPARVMDVLVCLAEQPGGVVSPDQLLDVVWHGHPHADNTVYQAINHLRKALGDDAHDPRYIETIAKRGYRLICPVTPVQDPVKLQATHGSALWRNLRRYPVLSLAGLLAMTALVIVAVANRQLTDSIDRGNVAGDDRYIRDSSFQAHDYYLLGRAYLQEETPSALLLAIDNFKHAIEADPNSARAFAGLSESYSDLYWTEPDNEFLEKAKSAAEHALRLDEEFGGAHRAIGYVKHYAGDYEGAIDSFAAAVRMDPSDIRSYAWLAAAYDEKGENSRAESILQTALEQNPMSGQLHNRMAIHILRYGDGDWNRAHEYFLRAIERQPDYPYPYVDVAYFLGRMGRLDEAITYARKAYELTGGPTMVDNSAYLLLSMLIDIGDHEIAIQLLKDMKAIEPDSPGVAVLEAQLQIAQQNLPQASTLVHRSVSEHLHDDALVSLFADYELLIGDVDHARHLYADLAAMPVATGADADAGLYQSSDLLWGALGAVNFAYLEKIGGESTTTSSLINSALQFIESSKTDYSPLEINGSVAYVRSQIAALLGDSDMAVDQLRQAVDAGWRRTWYARMDPIMAEVKEDRRFDEILDEVDASLLVMRDRLGTSARRL